MPKLPFMKFYPADYLLATRSLTDTEKAIWMDLLCYMWLKTSDRGRLDMASEDMARLVGRDRLTLEMTLNSLKEKDVCDLKTRADQTIFVECRRMIRDQKQLNITNKRVKRFNAVINASFNAPINASLTPKKTETRSQKTDKEKEVVPAAPRFIKPTLEQITAYCQERRNRIDPVRWLAHYESNGWRVGRNPMRDWRAAIRTWERSDFNASINPAHQPSLPKDEAKFASKTAELEKVKEREWAKRSKNREVNAGETPPWGPPFVIPTLKTSVGDP